MSLTEGPLGYDPIEYTEPQKKIEASQARFKVIMAGRRSGKSLYGVDWLIRQSISVPGERHWFVCKTHRQASEIAWLELNSLLPYELVRRKDNREMLVELVNDSIIQLKGSDKEDTLRGGRLGSLVQDEADFQKAHVYEQILRPRLADLKAKALFTSTPKPGWFVKLYNYAKSGVDKDWAAFHFTIYDNPYIEKAEIETIRKQCSPQKFRQEYLAEVLTEGGTVYSEFDLASVVSGDHFPNYRSSPCVVGIDYGINDNTAIVWVHSLQDGTLFVSNEHIQNGWSVDRHADVFKLRSRGLQIANGNVVLDGSAFRKEATSMFSIADILRREGISCQRSERDKMGTIDLVKRLMYGDGPGKPWIYFHDRCLGLTSSIQAWEDGEHEPDCLAALRYAVAHAAKRGLCKVMQGVRYDAGDPYVERIKESLGFRKLPPGGSQSRWNWDSSLGVPR